MGVSGYGFSYLMYWIGLVLDLWCLGWKHTMEMDGSRTDKLQIIIILSGLGRGIREWINNSTSARQLSLSSSSPIGLAKDNLCPTR